jgi:hypothetical protein
MVDELSCLLFDCTMPQAMKDTIITAVNTVSATDFLGRARMAIFLATTSALYQVQR